MTTKTAPKMQREKPKRPTSFKLSDTALGILSTLAQKRGIAKSALIENLLRAEYRADRKRRARADPV